MESYRHWIVPTNRCGYIKIRVLFTSIPSPK
jgi:hypothetical protein